jgi:macrolide transport system ATP-binding/permease protein
VARGVTLTDLGLLSGSDLSRPLGQLSVGQRRRVALGCIVANRPHVLVMDEPTNHLSLTLAEELEEALMTTLGAVIVASHDRWLRRRWNGDELRLERATAGGEEN